MKREFVILGGGLAGLSAAIRLAELGASPLLIEAGNYPSHKVCGEFLSPGSLFLLQQWGIHPTLIHQTHLHTPARSHIFHFPSPAGSLSHWQLDPALADLAIRKGAELLTSAKVLHLNPSTSSHGWHELTLLSGEKILARHLLVAAGRLPQFTSLPAAPRYIGIKAHFKGIDLKERLEMFSFPKAYIGLAPIEHNRCNIACLADAHSFQQANSAETFIDSLCQQHPLLKFYLSQGENLFTNWMQAMLPEFGIKQTPAWPNTYFIGDSAGTIPPASGNGLTMALIGGHMAADYAFKGQFQEFKKKWKRKFHSQILVGKLLHKLMFNPGYGKIFLKVNDFFPALSSLIYSLTR